MKSVWNCLHRRQTCSFCCCRHTSCALFWFHLSTSYKMLIINTVIGGFLTVLGALLSALPNVWYEKLLKTEGEDEWVRNVQVTCWIFLWIAVSQIWTSVQNGSNPLASPRSFASSLLGGSGLEGITPAVWLIVFLKSLNGILVPATLKYAGNLVYLYAKPTSIVATALLGALFIGTLPPVPFVLGAALVIGSMLTFSSSKN